MIPSLSLPAPPPVHPRRLGIGIPVLVVLAAVLIGAASFVVAAHVVPDTAADLNTDRRDGVIAIAAARSAIEGRMLDAQSITFGKVSVVWAGDVPAVCGLVDIVEQQDSFDGAERFVYVDGGLILEEIDGSDTVAQQWRSVCN
jgi:hypothetical protein